MPKYDAIKAFLGDTEYPVCTHTWKEKMVLYEKAEAENSFKSILNYPCILFRWQYKHPDDELRIAKLSSHRRDKHRWCKDALECEGLERFLKAESPGQKTLIDL